MAALTQRGSDGAYVIGRLLENFVEFPRASAIMNVKSET